MRVLSVTHGPSVPGGVFEETVERSGHRLDRWSVPVAAVPAPAAEYDAVLVFGGAMHPDEDARLAWLEPELDWLRDAVVAGVPLLGVCLGAQLIARAAGGWVGRADEPEVGWLAVELTGAGRDDPVLGALPPRFEAFQWHHYTFQVPDGGAELAASSVCTQAFAAGRARGIQFHAEVTREIIATWIAQDGHELPMPPADLLAETDRRIGSWNECGRLLCAAFLDDAA
jgi:GMP synthase-like glutamine amidotransferase